MKKIFALTFLILILTFTSPASSAYTNDELMNMNLQSLSADVTRDTAYSRGTGRIVRDAPNAITLARRAALTDARRGLLILKRELQEGMRKSSADVSGHVPPVKILSETESGDIYIVEVEAVLSELMREAPEETKETGEKDEEIFYGEEEEYIEEYYYDDEDEDGGYFPDVRSLIDKYGID